MNKPTTSENAMNDMVAFASRFNLTPSQSVVLPALFESAARGTGKTPAELVVIAAYQNQKLGDYLASVAREVAAKVAA